jgi:Flp pilus assembly protein TadG
MRPKASAQSIVEMAFVLPILLVVLFGIMEFGYLIFAYSSVSQAARNGAEAAAQLPPYETWLGYKAKAPADADYPGWLGDPCTNAVIEAVKTDNTLFDGQINQGRAIEDAVTISYPGGGNTRNLNTRGPIEVRIQYQVTGITPLYQLLNLNGNGTITLQVTQRRSLENLGNDPTKPRGVACAEDMASYRELYPKK